MDLLIYSFVLIFTVIIAYSNEYTQKKKTKKLPNMLVDHESKAPFFNIIIISSVLSLYSTYLATSGMLVDTVRFAWNFLYRYPLYYGSIEALFKSGTEVGFLFVNMLIGKITDEPFWLFLFIALITTFINLYVAAKMSKRYTLLVFLYLISLYFFQSTYILGQTLAVSFANLAFLSYLRELKFRYFLFSIIALSFHTTAIILFPMFFIFRKVNSAKVYIYILIITIVVFFMFNTVFSSVLPNVPFFGQFMKSAYIELAKDGGTLSVILKGLPFYFLTVVSLVKRKSLKKKLYKADFFIMCSVFYSISWIMSYNMYWFFRMGWYFLLPTLAIVPSLFYLIKNPKERTLYYTVFIFCLIIITYRQILITLG